MAKKLSIYRPQTGRRRKKSRPSGSALLIAIMVMGILMTLSLGVSQILVSTLRESGMRIDKTKAWYSAESAMEHALFDIAEHGPGFSMDKKLDEENFKYNYHIQGAAKQIPYKEDFEIHRDPTSPETFADLQLNDSVTIPLFSTLENGDTENIQDFRVDFYISPELLTRGGEVFKNLDVLRWKIFGIAKGGKNVGQMEVMNEFLPMEIEKTTSNNPSCLGTSTACWNGAKYFQWNESTGEYDIVNPFPIANFLRDHTQNFLVLTNQINTDLIADYSLTHAETQAISTIRYRVTQNDTTPNSRLSLPYVRVTADGVSHDIKQSLNAEIKRESFLPVFNYSLYRTVEGE